MSDNGSNMVFMPDAQYRLWVNKNAELLEKIVETMSVDAAWMNKGQNRQFLLRYLRQKGYTVVDSDD